MPLHLTTVGATSTAWNWTQQAPTPADLDAGTYGFYVQATDADNVAGVLVRRDFTLTASTGGLSVTSPEPSGGSS